MSETCILVKLLWLYFPWNWDGKSAKASAPLSVEISHVTSCEPLLDPFPLQSSKFFCLPFNSVGKKGYS
jgi:hypothetical protein